MNGTHDNDNDALPFISLAAATARLTSKIDKQRKNEKRDADREAAQGAKRKAEQQRRYVEQRLRELAAFERRARGD